jgi:hypothetical protein
MLPLRLTISGRRFTIAGVMSVRARGEDIRRFILQHVEKHPADISKIASRHFDITRQAINKHLRRLVDERSLTESGETRQKIYKLAPLLDWHKDFEITPELEEDVLWGHDVAPMLGSLPQNVLDIWHYGFTEMLNNAKDHSGGSKVMVRISKTAINTEMMISDNGIGIFKKIQEAFHLPDQRYAILELAKGKLTTDPTRHTGEGIFFSSRMFDRFAIGAGQTYFGHKFGDDEDWIMAWNSPFGTSVFMELDNHTNRTSKKIFDQYAPPDGDYGFNKTVVPVHLAQYGNDKLISRSQAKRVLARLELFKMIVLDFTGVPTIGQAFADEIFRVFAKAHPELTIQAIHSNSEVKRMIERAKTSSYATLNVPGSPIIEDSGPSQSDEEAPEQ